MKTKVGILTLIAAAALAALVLLPVVVAQSRGSGENSPATQNAGTATVGAEKLKVSGPHVHENLTVFLLHGTDRLKDKKFLTLSDAMQQRQVVIHETGDVNNLIIENTGDVTIYIQAGEIIKGGKQDRVIPFDCVVVPRSGKQPISSFCVEQGRWSRRGGEDAGSFGSSTNLLVGNAMKLAASLDNSQQKVWSEVARSQTKLSKSVGESVQSEESSTSLQLTLENKKLQESASAYQKKLAKIVAEHPDSIGLAVAVNGQVSSINVYASHALLAQLWPKLLEAAAMEAVGESKPGLKFTQATADDLDRLMKDVEQAKAKTKIERVNPATEVRVRDAKDAALFQTSDDKGVEVHRSYLKK